MLLNNKLKKELKSQGREQAIDGILRSQFSEIEMNGGDRALEILRDPQERKKATKKIKRDSKRNSPYSTTTNLSIAKIQNSPITMIISATLPLAAALMFFVLYQLYTTPDQIAGSPHITYTGKNIQVIRNGKPLNTQLNMEILNLDSITIPYGEKVNITYDDGSALELLSNSTVTFGNPSTDENKIHLDQKLIELKHGEIHVSVSKQAEKYPMLLNTSKAIVKVLGTKFRLSNTNEKTIIQMEKGFVEFTNISINKSISVKDRETAIVTENSISLKKPEVKTETAINIITPRITKNCLVSYKFNLDSFQNNLFKNNFPQNKSIKLKYTGTSQPNILKMGGLNISSQISLSNSENAKEILEEIQKSNEISFELWLKPADNSDVNNHSMLIAFSKEKELFGQPHWLFFLGQKGNSIVLSMNTDTKEGFDNQLEFNNIFEDNSIAHIVITKDKDGIVTLFKNGISQKSIETKGNFTSLFTNKDKVYLNLTGNNTKSHSWNGVLFLSAIYDRALNSEEIQQNYLSKY